jgi:hypothetical protein
MQLGCVRIDQLLERRQVHVNQTRPTADA